MLVEAEVEYVAGGWPGERYTGTHTVTANAEEYESDEGIRQLLCLKARKKIADSYCFHLAQVKVTEYKRIR